MVRELRLSDGTNVPSAAPFFITGSGRCGTTLLRRLLLEHAPVAIPPENYTLAQTGRLCERAGEEWGAFCRSLAVRPAFTASVGRWRNPADAERVKQIAYIVEPMRVRLGYA